MVKKDNKPKDKDEKKTEPNTVVGQPSAATTTTPAKPTKVTPAVVAPSGAGSDKGQGEDWGDSRVDDDQDVAASTREYDPKKDQDLHILAMHYLGYVAVIGIVLGGLIWLAKGDTPEFIGVVVGASVTGIAALFSKKA